MAWVYILETDVGYYVGSTTNLVKRMRHHTGGFTQATSKMGKPKLVFSQEYDTLSQARRIESKLKALKRKDYIEKILKDGFIKLRA